MKQPQYAQLFQELLDEGASRAEAEQEIVARERKQHFPVYALEYGKLFGKVAIVSGAAGGQGEMDAKLLAQQGAKVVLVDLVDEELIRIERDIHNDGGVSIAVVSDVTNERQWQALAQQTVDTFGSIDILVNNATVIQSGGLLEETRESMNHLMDVNCWGTFYGMKACAPFMIEGGGGSIVNICSIQGAHFGPENLLAYSMSKSAVAGMSRAASADLARYGIRVNTVNPGAILTPPTYERIANREAVAASSALKRFGLAEEVARVVLFLASDDSSYVTGQSINVDGGVSTYLHLPG